MFRGHEAHDMAEATLIQLVQASNHGAWVKNLSLCIMGRVLGYPASFAFGMSCQAFNLSYNRMLYMP